MSWSQGNIQWTFPFKSLNETSCRIDVYKKGYTGSFVYTLKAAANPFFYEEDEDSDILNNVVRYRTGYIRVIEEYGTGWLNDMYPTDFFDRYVEVYYGEILAFNGFIQVQDFSSEQVPTPRVLEFPVISPMGLFNKKIFRNILPPQSVSLGYLLNQAASGYDYVYFPDRYGYPNPVSMNMEIFSLVVSPWNEDYHHSMNTGAYNKIMKGESYEFLIEAICKAFGWICHDTPSALIFTAFDYEDTYCRFPVGHIGEAGYKESVDVPSTAVALTDYFENADNAANMTTLLPDTGIEIGYGGDSDESHPFSLDRMYIPEQNAIITMPSMVGNSPDEIFSICNLLPIAQLYELTPIQQLSFNNDDHLNVGHGCCAWNGMEGIMISIGTYSTNFELFKLRFYLKRRSGQGYYVSYDMKGIKNGALGGLAFNESDIDKYYIKYEIDTTNDDYIEVSFKYRWGGNTYPQLPMYALIFIHNIELKVYEDNIPYSDYIYKPAKESDILPEDYDPQPAVSSSIDMPISLYRLNDNLIGTSLRSTRLTTYPYLFQPRKELVSKFRIISNLTLPHMRLFNYMSKKWRIIAQRFDLWNDEMKLTMQNSPIL